MNEVYIRAEQLLADCHALNDELPVVEDELQVEERNPPAGVALAGGSPPHPFDPIAEGEIRCVDAVEDGLRVPCRAVRLIGKDCASLQLGQGERRHEAISNHLEQVTEDLVCMLQLGS